MRALLEFDASLHDLRPSTKRLYLAGAKALLRAAFPGPLGPGGVASYAELWARTRDVKLPKPARARPFLRFLQSRQGPAPPEDLEPVRRWVLEALDKANRLQKNPSVTDRRDAALLAALCAAPTRGNPRVWPKGCLAVTETGVTLWEEGVQQPALALALRYWHLWRERLSRPDQRRLHRKSLAWGQSALLFPGPGGAPLASKALHNALRRLTGAGEGGRAGIGVKIRGHRASHPHGEAIFTEAKSPQNRVYFNAYGRAGLTPEKIRAAFLAAGGGRPPAGPA